MELEHTVFLPGIDHPFHQPQPLLGERVGSRPEQDDDPTRLQYPVKFGHDPVNLVMKEVLHDADIPDTVNRIGAKGQPEYVSPGPKVHDRVAVVKDGDNDIRRNQDAISSVFVDQV